MTGFRAGPAGYWVQAWYSTANAALNGLTLGHKLLLEGRRRDGAWHNWTHGERCEIDDQVAPNSEQGIIDRILSEPKLRCVGSGHSFNAAVRGQALLSLDNWTGVIEGYDHGRLPDETGVTYVRVRAGTRVRDVNRELAMRGLAIAALPSHDSQSVAGILSTDVHGTGRDIGYVSASVVGLRIIDGTGAVHDVWAEDPLFKAAIGGIGAVGVITEASLRCIPAFNIEQRTSIMAVDRARATWKELLTGNEHMSFYVFPFADVLHFHTWNRTNAKRSRRAGLREFLSISWAALGAAWIGDAFAWSRRLPRLANWAAKRGKHTDLVMDSAAGFNRTIYPMHQELEFAAPIERTWEIIDRLTEIYETMYTDARLPYTLLEVRFTPAGGTASLIGAGAGDQAMVWITIVCNQSRGFADYLNAAERYFASIRARPHLGKWCEQCTYQDLATVHGPRFGEFRQLMAVHDPYGRFRNEFVDRMFGPRDPFVGADPTLADTSVGDLVDLSDSTRPTRPTPAGDPVDLSERSDVDVGEQ